MVKMRGFGVLEVEYTGVGQENTLLRYFAFDRNLYLALYLFFYRNNR